MFKLGNILILKSILVFEQSTTLLQLSEVQLKGIKSINHAYKPGQVRVAWPLEPAQVLWQIKLQLLQ